MDVDKIIKSTKLAFDKCESNNKIVEKSIKDCSKNLRNLRAKMNALKTVGEKQQFLNTIKILQSYRTKLKLLRLQKGEGYTPPHPNRKNYASYNVKWEDVDSAFRGRIRTGLIINLSHKDPFTFLEDCGKLFCCRINNLLKKEQAVKVNAVLCGEFKKFSCDEEIIELKYINTSNKAIYNNTDVQNFFAENIKNALLKKLEEFQEKDSGWALSSIINLAININKFTPQLGSSYLELPPEIMKKKACVNVKNSDDACFAWAVVSALYPTNKNPQRTAKYPHYSKVLNWDNISFPMTVKQVPRFEKQNEVSINIYSLIKKIEKLNVCPIYLTKDKKDKHVNLLLIQNKYCDEEGDVRDIQENDDDEPIKYHYVWIKNLSRLLSSQLSKDAHKKHFCDRCLHYFYTSAGLMKHTENCMTQNFCKIRLPTKEQSRLEFKNHQYKIEAPFVIYADLECLLQECNEKNKYQEHKPCSVGYYVKCSYDDTLSFYKSFRGKNCIKWFVQELQQFAEDVETTFLCDLPMDALTEEQISQFKTSKICHICESQFTDDDKKVHDHCHLTGKYRGPAHEGCNINFKDTHTLPVIFHNLSGYDSHFIIKSIAKDLKGRVDLLPINKERYISFTKRLDEYFIKYRFIDSFRFMCSSLDTLASLLTAFPILKSEFMDITTEQFNLLKRKGIYPYDYMDDDSKFSETCLPPINNFYNKLNDTNISLDEYNLAKTVWREFNIQNLGDYTDLYLKTDVLLLADTFEQFRSKCMKNYGLDPAHYFTLPGYTWDAMLKHSNITLELLTDIDMLMFVERGIRGGLSQCSKRYTKVNNKYCTNYDSSQPPAYLMYYDINNQYGWAMSQPLPHSGFKWVGNLENFNVEDLKDDSPVGYILEVDIEYPNEIHDLHKDLPFCPEHCCAPESKQKKLMATLYNKTKYVIHYRNLKQAIKNGLKVNKIHRILQFNQSTWLKNYIDLNTKLRTCADNEFEKNLFKLMNNAVFGKTMENVRKYSTVKLVTKWLGRYGAEALISKPEFKSSTIFDENLVAIELNKTEVFFNKPIYVGMCILDLAKTTLYDFHYDYMQNKFGKNCNICYTDTDSLIYEVSHLDIYEIMKLDCYSHFDTSDYPVNNQWGIPLVNKKKLGLMKDENNGLIMNEFVGLRSKMYAVRVENVDKIKKSKGVKRQIVKNRLTFNDYVECLNNTTEKLISQNLIQSQKHEVSSVIQLKIALSPHDDKRYLIKNSYETLPWGHYSIMETL